MSAEWKFIDIILRVEAFLGDYFEIFFFAKAKG
jgi:hypothetical protein